MRQCARKNHHASFYFDLADPISTLMLPVIEELEQAFKFSFDISVVNAVDDEYQPESELREKHALIDASYLAQAWGLEFPTLIPNQSRLKPEALRLLLSKQSTVGEWIQLAKEVTKAYWQGDYSTLHAMLKKYHPVDILDVPRLLDANTRKLRRRGFFAGSSILYGKEWYVGLDRLYLLRARLKKLSLQEHRTLLYPDWGDVRTPCIPDDPVELYFSFRSPYSYIAIARLMKNKSKYPVDRIQLRPVMPMVTRGIPLPKSKKLYILKDAARVAHFENIDFGWVRDPLGEGVNACLALLHHCDSSEHLTLSYRLLHDIWAGGKDVSSTSYIRDIIKAFNLSAEAVGRTLINKDYAVSTEANQKTLIQYGLWGVPSFIKGRLATWGQDRMPLVFSRAFD